MAMDRISAAEKAAVSDVRLAAADIAARAAQDVIAARYPPKETRPLSTGPLLGYRGRWRGEPPEGLPRRQGHSDWTSGVTKGYRE